MFIDIREKIEKLFNVNLLIALALVTSTFTQLRFPGVPVGFSDILFLLYIGYSFLAILYTYNSGYSYSILQPTRATLLPVIIFLLIFVFLMTTGTLFSEITEIDTGLSPHHNLFAFFYLAILFLFIFIRGDIDVGLTARYTTLILALVVSIAVVISLFTKDFIGVDFYYLWTDRLMLLTRSPNHLADFISPLPFLLLYFLFNSKSKTFQGLMIILVLLVLLAGVMSQSKATLLAWAIAMSFLLFKLIYSSPYTRYIIGFFTILLLLMFLIFQNEFNGLFFHGTKNILDSGNNLHLNQGILYDIYIRTGLIYNAIELANLSPIFGYGAGASTGITEPFLGREAHNHIADILIISGYFGLLMYLLLMFFIAIQIVNSKKDLLLAAFIVITIVSLFHFQLRQPLFWFYLIFILHGSSIFTAKNKLT